MSDASIESALEPVKLLQRICERGRDDGGRLALQTLCLAQPGATGRVRRDRLRFRAVWAWLSGLFRPETSLPATASPRSRASFMITFGFATTR